MVAAVHLEEDIEPTSRGVEDRPETRRTLDAVRPHGEPHAVGEREQATRLVGADDGISEEEIVEACRGKDFRLARLRERDPRRARRELQAPDLRDLVRLGVRTQPDAGLQGAGRHALDVLLDDVEVHDDRRRVEIRDEETHFRKA